MYETLRNSTHGTLLINITYCVINDIWNIKYCFNWFYAIGLNYKLQQENAINRILFLGIFI